jgi:hypothetical protein
MLGNKQRHDPHPHHTKHGWPPFRCASRVIEVGITCRSGSFPCLAVFALSIHNSHPFHSIRSLHYHPPPISFVSSRQPFRSTTPSLIYVSQPHLRRSTSNLPSLLASCVTNHPSFCPMPCQTGFAIGAALLVCAFGHRARPLPSKVRCQINHSSFSLRSLPTLFLVSFSSLNWAFLFLFHLSPIYRTYYRLPYAFEMSGLPRFIALLFLLLHRLLSLTDTMWTCRRWYCMTDRDTDTLPCE